MYYSNQRGAALFTGLVLLIVITIIAITSSRGTILQERMTGNVSEFNAAFQLSEDTLRQVEIDIRDANRNNTAPNVTLIPWGQTSFELSDCSGSELLLSADPDDPNQAWVNAPGVATGQVKMYRALEMISFREGLPCRPYESIQNGKPPRSSFYLIAAYSEGPAGRARVINTSTYFFDLGI